jgi:uracil-DNA glycosylase
MSDHPQLPSDWQVALGAEFAKDHFNTLMDFIAQERRSGQVFPAESEVFSAFGHSPFNDTKVVIIGQDPYHDVGQAHGLCFSVKPGVATPPSLLNMYKELRSDLGCSIPNNGYLVPWAKQGILMLNAVMTVRAHTPNSHKDHGWEQFTDAAIKAISARAKPAVFLLLGNYAKKKAKLVDTNRHIVIECAHPSPLSLKLFTGSRPFSRVNAALAQFGETPIDWQIPNH